MSDVASQPPAHLEAVDLAGQPDVEDHEPRMAIGDVLEAPLAGGRLVHAEAGVAQVQLDEVGDVGIVLDQDDRDGFSRHGAHRGIRS